MSDEELKALVVRLKTGEEDGYDIMKVWILIEDYIIGKNKDDK